MAFCNALKKIDNILSILLKSGKKQGSQHASRQLFNSQKQPQINNERGVSKPRRVHRKRQRRLKCRHTLPRRLQRPKRDRISAKLPRQRKKAF